MPKSKTKKNKKVSDSKKEEDNVKAETIKDIYESGEEIVIPTKAMNWLAVLVVSVLVGLIGGFFGGWWQAIYQPSWLAINMEQKNELENLSDLMSKAADQSKKIKNSFDQITLDNLNNQVVSIYEKPTNQGNSPVDGVFTQQDLLGHGLVVTSDGWLITASDLITDYNKDYLVITSDRRGYEIEDYVLDNFTGLLFIKISATDLSPINISTAAGIKNNDEILTINRTLKAHESEVRYVKIINNSYSPYSTISDLQRSTENISEFLLLDQALPDYYLGSMLATAEGRVIGLISGKDDLNSHAIPGFYLQLAVTNFLTDLESVPHNSLGIQYYDLSEAIGLDKNLHQGYSYGALIYAADDEQAIFEDSPAAKSNLQEGDLMLAVNDQRLGPDVNLSRVLQEYPLEATITFTVLTEEGEEDFIITLDATP